MSLIASLNIAANALMADSAAIQSTNSNIANANTPGYTRKLAVFEEVSPTTTGAASAGNGVVLSQFQSVRDELLQGAIVQQTQAKYGADARLSSLQQIESTFSASTNDIGSRMSALFTSLSSLSTDPTNASLRQSVLTAGQNLATAFHTASGSLSAIQLGINGQVSQDVDRINSLSRQIAALNPQIHAAQESGQDAGALQDQRDQLTLQLSQLTSLAVTNTTDGITLTTGNGTPLVVGSQSFSLHTTTSNSGMTNVADSSGIDITSSLAGGDLGGSVQARDQVIPSLQHQLDSLASELACAFNAVQSGGFDQNGNHGASFFHVPSAVDGSAGSISVALAGPESIAASSDGAAGDNANLANFAAIQSNKLPGGLTPTDAYADLVYKVGSLTANASADSQGLAASLVQLSDQRSAVSGVSIDEESTRLIQYQQAYEAAARVISTVQTLFQVTISMGTA